MVSCLSLTYATLKSEVVDYHKGKFELEAKFLEAHEPHVKVVVCGP